MTPVPDLPAGLYDHVVRAVIAFERDGEAALVREIAAAGALAAQVGEHVESMRAAGLLQEPEQPEQVGPYRVLQRIGSGGMGTVFLCEQTEPVRRRVAVKVLRAGMDSAEILARFRLERRALAALDHPGIAALLDAGTTEQGRPFLVMEYVAGLHLMRYCDERQLDARSRLELFGRVCDAVQHAHHKGIVHRDLKPSNVLVVDRDGAPWPIVIDFGVAKSLGERAANATLLTLPGAMLGTPEYMSPEQATHEIDVDTRADVYSLGVMLYELLTGTLPIERERLRHGDVAKVLGDTEPPTPSSRLTALGDDAAAAAANRRLDVAGLRRFVRGDLDWVAMRAIEKDRNRRYGMPAELAADIRRFLAHEPVSAGPVSSWYRLKKLCARNRVQAAALGTALAAITGALVVSTWFWRDAVASSRASEESLDDALTAVEELVAVGDSDLVDVPHLTAVRRGLLERSMAFYRRFVGRHDADDQRLQPRIAEALVRLGCLQSHLGDHAVAVATLRDADARIARLPAGAIPVLLQVRGLDTLAETAEHLGDASGAIEAAVRAEALLRAAFAADAAPATRVQWIRVLVRRSRQLAPVDRDRALAVAIEARDLGAPFVGPDANDTTTWPTVIDAGGELARRLLEHGRRDDALQALDAAFGLWQRSADRSNGPGLAWRLTVAVGEIAAQFARCDDYGRMVEVLAAVEAVYTRLVADHPVVPAYHQGLGRTRIDKARALMTNFRFTDAITTAAAGESDYTAALALAGDDPTLLRDGGRAAIFLANSHQEARRKGTEVDLEPARAARARAAERIERLAQLPAGADSAARLRIEERRLFALLHEAPASAEATAALATACELAARIIADDPSDLALRERAVEMRARYGHALRQQGDLVAALAVLEPALQEILSLRGSLASHEVWVVRHLFLRAELARVAAAQGDAEQAAAHLRASVEADDERVWRSKLDVARLALELARGPMQHQPALLLDSARIAVRAAHRAGDLYVQNGMPDGTPAMVAAMRASTWLLLVDVERLAGDAVAEAAALGEVVACRAEARGHARGGRADAQCREACAAWLERLAAIGDPIQLAAAGERILVHADGDADGLLQAAKLLGAFAASRGVRGVGSEHHAALRATGAALLQRAVAAGADAACFAADADLQPLLETPGH